MSPRDEAPAIAERIISDFRDSSVIGVGNKCSHDFAGIIPIYRQLTQYMLVTYLGSKSH